MNFQKYLLEFEYPPSEFGKEFDKYRNQIKKEFGYDIRMWCGANRGGFGDGTRMEELTKFDLDQIIKGIRVEFEHTDSVGEALKIVVDHLTENPKYYDFLEKMEKEMDAKKVVKKEEPKEETKKTDIIPVPDDRPILVPKAVVGTPQIATFGTILKSIGDVK